MRLRLRVRPPASRSGTASIERTVELDVPAGGILVGRRVGLEVTLPFLTVSSQHARIEHREATFWVEDLGSANGTTYGGRTLEPRVPVAVRLGDVVQFGDVAVTFVAAPQAGVATGSGERPESTATLARRLVADLFGATRAAEVPELVIEGPGGPKRTVRFEWIGAVIRVGRAPSCDVVLTDDGVSREHAAFDRRADGVVVRDLGSKNGVSVGGQRAHGEVRLRDGDEAVVGGTRFLVQDPEDRYLRQMEEGGDAVSAPVRATAPIEANAPPAAAPGAGRAIMLIAAGVLLCVASLVAWLALG